MTSLCFGWIAGSLTRTYTCVVDNAVQRSELVGNDCSCRFHRFVGCCINCYTLHPSLTGWNIVENCLYGLLATFQIPRSQEDVCVGIL